MSAGQLERNETNREDGRDKYERNISNTTINTKALEPHILGHGTS